MTVGGSDAFDTYINDVELSSLDPQSSPVPDCLQNLSGLPVTRVAGAAVDYTRRFCERGVVI